MSADHGDKILLVDDDPYVLEMLSKLFDSQYKCFLASTGAESIEVASGNKDIAAVVMDIKMADMTGLKAAREIRELLPDISIIFHTGYPGYFDEDVIDKQEEPFDFVLKGETVSRLIRSVRNAVGSFKLKTDRKQLTEYAESKYGIVGKSAGMQAVYSLIRKLAASDSKAMILGETGTGKELVARALHYGSRRADQRLAILNCNHKSSELVESELFGHVKGTFTGAVNDRPGLFEYADGGTVFLDEIGDLDTNTQNKLLRVIERGEYTKLGDDVTQKSDVRVLCATHKNLEELVEQGSFREDLYFRLKGVKVFVPPLRERREDIPLLLEHYRDKFTIERGLSPTVFDPSAVEALINYDWPGNVRQLIETVESLIVLSESDLILADDVNDYLNLKPEAGQNGTGTLTERMQRYERTLIIQALTQTNYNISAAARILQLDRTNLKNKIRKHNIDHASFRE